MELKVNKSSIEAAINSAGDDRVEYKLLDRNGFPIPNIRLRVSKHKVTLTATRRHEGKQRRASIAINKRDVPNASELNDMIDGIWSEKIEKPVLAPSLTKLCEDMLERSDLKTQSITNYRTAIKRVAEHTYDKAPASPREISDIHHSITLDYGPSAANTALKVARRVIRFGRAMGHDIPEWPTEAVSVAKTWHKEQPRDRRLTATEIAPAWNADLPEPWGRLLRFLLLTGFRRNEALRAEQLGDQFVVPDTKNGTTHRIPATDAAMTAWAGGFGVKCAKPMTKFLKKQTGLTLSPHDCRRTFASTAVMAGVQQHVVSHLLNHRSALSTVTSGYQGRPDDDVLRRALLDIEATYKALGASVE